MHRQHLLKELECYTTSFRHESKMKEEIISFIHSTSQCFDRNFTQGHMTGSAWILNENGDSVLLMHHRKLDKWLQLGGHADGESRLMTVALNEAKEESGLDSISPLSDSIFDLDIHVIPNRLNEPEHFHYDIRYLFKTDDSIPLKKNHESIDLAWVSLSQIDHYTVEESILRMVEKTKSYK